MVKRIRVCFACRAKDEKYGVYHGNEKINNNFEKSLHQEILGKFHAEKGQLDITMDAFVSTVSSCG